MAKIVEQSVSIKLSKLFPNSSEDLEVLTQEQLSTIHSSILELVESLIQDPSILIEVNETDE